MIFVLDLKIIGLALINSEIVGFGRTVSVGRVLLALDVIFDIVEITGVNNVATLEGVCFLNDLIV